MSIAELMRTELPLNRKERYFTGTVFPMIVGAEGFRHFHRFLDLLPGIAPITATREREAAEQRTPEEQRRRRFTWEAGDTRIVRDWSVDFSPAQTNVQFFTEYGLLESIFTDADRLRFPVAPSARDTPDIVILIDGPPKILIALEGKMYDSLTTEALVEQMDRQRTIVLDVIASALEIAPADVIHTALIPRGLAERLPGFPYPVITWEQIHDAFTDGREEDYFLAVLRLATESYSDLVGKRLTFGRNADHHMKGRAIYESFKAGTLEFPTMGRQLGLNGDELREDIESGRWTEQTYEVSRRPDPANRNWFLVSDFVEVIDAERRAEQTPE
ncbi:MAG: hypothetical protein WD757_06840 [Actinomycetota bacterium]